MCDGFCGNSESENTTAVVSVPSTQNQESLQLSPAQALQNEVFLSAFFLPFSFYLLGLSKGIILKFIKRI